MKKLMNFALCVLCLCAIPLIADQPSIEPPPINPLDQDSDRFFMEFVRMMSVLGLVIVALMFLTWYLKRFMNSRITQLNSSSLIKVVERRDLTPKTALYILEVNEQQFLIAETHNGVTALGDLRSNKRTPSAFSKMLDGNESS